MGTPRHVQNPVHAGTRDIKQVDIKQGDDSEGVTIPRRQALLFMSDKS